MVVARMNNEEAKMSRDPKRVCIRTRRVQGPPTAAEGGRVGIVAIVDGALLPPFRSLLLVVFLGLAFSDVIAPVATEPLPLVATVAKRLQEVKVDLGSTLTFFCGCIDKYEQLERCSDSSRPSSLVRDDRFGRAVVSAVAGAAVVEDIEVFSLSTRTSS
jgi:hypothetical protein